MKKVICVFSLLFIAVYLGQIFVSAQSNESQPNVAVAKENLQQSPVEVPEVSEKAINYSNGSVGWSLFYSFWNVLIPFLFLLTKASAKIRDFSQKISGRWYFTVAIYFVIYLLFNFLIYLPLKSYMGYFREHDYGLSNQTFFQWVTEDAIELGLNIILGSLLLWIPYLILRKSPKRWWFYASFLSVPFFILIILIATLFLQPLNDNLGSMKDKNLEAKVLQLADRVGIEGSQVYEVEKSDDTKTMNAYMTGLFNTKRVVLWDTTIRGLNEDELLFVVAHEMGHYVLGHIKQDLMFTAIVTFFFFFLIYKISTYLTKRFGKKWGFSELSDPAAMPLLILVLYALLFVFEPISLGKNRYQEHEADRFALEVTRSNRACGTAFVKMQTDNLANPRPSQFIKIINASHPPLGERIDFCNEYKPWEKGESLKYEGYYKGN